MDSDLLKIAITVVVILVAVAAALVLGDYLGYKIGRMKLFTYVLFALLGLVIAFAIFSAVVLFDHPLINNKDLNLMPDWQITAKTVFCDGVDDEVTWLVYRDGTTRCTGCLKYGRPNDITRQVIREKTRRLQRAIRCEGENCPRISVYKDQIFSEEAKSNG